MWFRGVLRSLPSHRSLLLIDWVVKSALSSTLEAIDMSLQDIEAALCEFCEAIIHELLYQRQIYSQDLFQRHRLYDVVVRRSRHQKLNDYIHSVVQSIRVTRPSQTPWTWCHTLSLSCFSCFN